MANVLPVLMYNPSSVFLFETPEESKSGDNLKKLFESKSINVKRIPGLNAYDYIEFKKKISEKLEKTSGEVWLNVTGGTKLMALAAYEAFAEKDKKIIYCDTEHENIIHLYPEVKIEKLSASLKIPDYLLSYGYNIDSLKDFKLIQQYFDLFNFIDSKNLFKEFILFYKNIRKKLPETHPKFTVVSVNKNFIFRKDYSNYKIEYGKPGRKIISIDSSDFKSGDWLEYYVYYKLVNKYNMSPISGVRIKSNEGVENEIDVMAIKNYKLYSFSCKSGKADNQFDLYQLETLRNITSGTFGKGIFVTANRTNESFRKRARELNIKIINLYENHSFEI